MGCQIKNGRLTCKFKVPKRKGDFADKTNKTVEYMNKKIKEYKK